MTWPKALTNMDLKTKIGLMFWGEERNRRERRAKGEKKRKRKRKKMEEPRSKKVWNLTLGMDFFYGILKFV